MTDSVPDLLGTRDIEEKSLRTVGGTVANRNYRRWISFCASLSSSFKRASEVNMTWL